jgi:hypothetical protein
METLTAFFENQRDLEHAAQALQDQGAVHVTSEAATSPYLQDAEIQALSLQPGYAKAASPVNLLQIVVESSRLRQAEDTIARYGGWAVQAR